MTKKIIKKMYKKKSKGKESHVCESDHGAAEIADIEAEVEDWDKDVVKR